MSDQKKQIEEMAEILRKVCDATPNGKCIRKLCCVCRAETVIEAGYRKQSVGEWITKHRHRGGFRTVTVVDSFGEKHTGTVDDRWECDDLYCSVCGKIAHDAFLNYCANCGAKMGGGEK